MTGNDRTGVLPATRIDRSALTCGLSTRPHTTAVCSAGRPGGLRRRMRAALILAIGLVGCGPSMVQGQGIDRELFAVGIELYNDNCAVCHGENGDGKGTLASGFAPRPRDLTLGLFKFRSTNPGEFATREDLFATIRNGIKGSYGQTMPRFEHLSDDDLVALAEVIRVASAANDFGTAVEPPPRPRFADVARGEALYQQLNCIGCHGVNGDGRGALAAELTDSDGLSIKPADFRVGQFKGGNEPEDIWMRLYTGIDGTPMPTFGRNTSGEDLWALVEYVLTFSNSGS